MARKQSRKGDTPSSSSKAKRPYVSQADVPSYSLDDAMRVPTAIADNYAGKPVSRLALAQAMQMQPTGGAFRSLCGASIAYGLTQGGAQAEEISLDTLGRRITMPTAEGDDAIAKREALLKPRVVGDFLKKYDKAKLPPKHIAVNVLVEMKVPRDGAEKTYDLIVEGARRVGLLRTIKDVDYVELNGVSVTDTNTSDEEPQLSTISSPSLPSALGGVLPESTTIVTSVARMPTDNRKVFITHGKSRDIVPQLKELLTFGQFEPVVSVDRESVSKPVPDKVIDDMRLCGAAIIHVDAERRLTTESGQEEIVLNPNVLIEIGAAMALYRRNFILLVEQAVTLPSNLQGLYTVRYEGKELTYAAAMKLLKAFNDFRKEPGVDGPVNSLS